ncbi:MAG: diversity-generating retroelement protein Avd [Cyanobacteria bacterium J06555_13]
MATELPIIQKSYDLIKWYVPIIQRLPRDYRFTLGDRMMTGLYSLLEGLIQARYLRDKMALLRDVNASLDILRYQTRLLLDFELIQTSYTSLA